MIVRSEMWNYEIPLYQDKVNLIVVPNLEYLYQVARDFVGQENGEDGKYQFFNDDRNLRFDSEVELITDMYKLSFLNRKITTSLQKRLIKEIFSQGIVDRFEEINRSISALLSDIRKSTLIHFTYDEEVGVEDIVKMYNVQYFDKYNNPYEMLYHYLDIVKDISKLKLLIIFHPLEFLNEDQLNELGQVCQFSNIYLLLFSKEKIVSDKLNVSISVIDQDMCYT